MLPIILFYYIYFFQEDYLTNLLSYWIMVYVGLIYHKKFDKLFILIKILLILNAFLVAYEFFNFKYIWNLSEDPFYGRAKGLFSAPKEAGMFISVFLIVFFEKITLIDFLYILITSLFIGSRTLFLISLVAFIPLFFIFIRNSKKSLKFVVYILVLIFPILIVYYFDSFYTSFEVIGRLDSLANTQEGGNELRIFVLIEGLKAFFVSPIQEIFFGLGTRVEILLGNGAENAYLNILMRYGIFGLLFFILLIMYPYNYKSRYGKFVYVFFLLLLFGNRGLAGMVDTFLFTCYIGSLLRKRMNFTL